MIWFAPFRPKFRKVVAATMIISALASAGSEIKKLESYDQAKAAYSEILELNQVRQKNEKAVKEAYKLLIEAADLKTYAEELSKRRQSRRKQKGI